MAFAANASRKSRLVAARISHPLASYDNGDKLVCKRCKMQVDPLLWRMHVQRHDDEVVEIEADSPPERETKRQRIHNESMDVQKQGGDDRDDGNVEPTHVDVALSRPSKSSLETRNDLDAEWTAFQAEISTLQEQVLYNEIPEALREETAPEDLDQDISTKDHAAKLRQLKERLKRLKTRNKE